MMDGHGQIARKNYGPWVVPVPVFACTGPCPSCPYLKKVTLPVFAREFCSGNFPEIKSDNEMLFENKIILSGFF